MVGTGYLTVFRPFYFKLKQNLTFIDVFMKDKKVYLLFIHGERLLGLCNMNNYLIFSICHFHCNSKASPGSVGCCEVVVSNWTVSERREPRQLNQIQPAPLYCQPSPARPAVVPAHCPVALVATGQQRQPQEPPASFPARARVAGARASNSPLWPKCQPPIVLPARRSTLPQH